MYYHHFGLSGPPFQFTPAADTLYLSREHREALALLEWGILHEPTGFAVLVGESGVGKTTLVFSVIARRCGNVQAALVSNPRLSFEQMMTVVLSQLGSAAGGLSKYELIQRFVRLLDDRGAETPVAIILDEAQELSDEVFGELRLLSNQDTATERKLRIVFVGQPELLERLRTPQLRALNQRIGARVILSPMQPTEAYDYVNYRLRAKGLRSARVFVPTALRHLIGHSHGIPRRINVLCHNAMLTAYGAQRRRVDLASAKSAVAEYENLFFPAKDSRAVAKARPTRWVRALLVATGTAAMLTALVLAMIERRSWLAQIFAGSEAAVESRSDIGSTANSPVLGPEAFLQPAPAASVAVEATPTIIGGNAGVRQTASAATLAQQPGIERPANPSGRIRSIRVHGGDTLSKIAARYLGSSDAVDQIVNANPKLRNLNHIYPGETVNLPAAQSAATDQAKP